MLENDSFCLELYVYCSQRNEEASPLGPALTPSSDGLPLMQLDLVLHRFFLPDEAVVQREGDADGEQQVPGRVQPKPRTSIARKASGRLRRQSLNVTEL